MEPASENYRLREREIKQLKNGIRVRFARLMNDANEHLAAVYAYYSPFAAVIETKGSLGRSKEQDEFRDSFRKMLFGEILKYKRGVDQMEAKAQKNGYTVNESLKNRYKERRLLLSTCPDEEKAYWKEIAAGGEG